YEAERDHGGDAILVRIPVADEEEAFPLQQRVGYPHHDPVLFRYRADIGLRGMVRFHFAPGLLVSSECSRESPRRASPSEPWRFQSSAAEEDASVIGAADRGRQGVRGVVGSRDCV